LLTDRRVLGANARPLDNQLLITELHAVQASYRLKKKAERALIQPAG